MIFEEKYFLRYILLTDQISLPLLLEILRNICFVIVCCPLRDAMVFEIDICCLIMETWSVFLYDQKSQDKNLNILITKRDFNVKDKAFLIVSKGLSLKHIKNSFEGESPTLTICLLPQNQFKLITFFTEPSGQLLFLRLD